MKVSPCAPSLPALRPPPLTIHTSLAPTAPRRSENGASGSTWHPGALRTWTWESCSHLKPSTGHGVRLTIEDMLTGPVGAAGRVVP